MNLNNLLQNKKIDPRNVLVLRHRPHERELNKVLPWFAAEKPNIFNAYQQTQGEKLQKVMKAMVAHGHGGNSLLRQRDPKNFQFSILQRVSPDMDARDLIQIENSWKKRLHTRSPEGLNDN